MDCSLYIHPWNQQHNWGDEHIHTSPKFHGGLCNLSHISQTELCILNSKHVSTLAAPIVADWTAIHPVAKPNVLLPHTCYLLASPRYWIHLHLFIFLATSLVQVTWSLQYGYITGLHVSILTGRNSFLIQYLQLSVKNTNPIKSLPCLKTSQQLSAASGIQSILLIMPYQLSCHQLLPTSLTAISFHCTSLTALITTCQHLLYSASRTRKAYSCHHIFVSALVSACNIDYRVLCRLPPPHHSSLSSNVISLKESSQTSLSLLPISKAFSVLLFNSTSSVWNCLFPWV